MTIGTPAASGITSGPRHVRKVLTLRITAREFTQEELAAHHYGVKPAPVSPPFFKTKDKLAMKKALASDKFSIEAAGYEPSFPASFAPAPMFDTSGKLVSINPGDIIPGCQAFAVYAPGDPLAVTVDGAGAFAVSEAGTRQAPVSDTLTFSQSAQQSLSKPYGVDSLAFALLTRFYNSNGVEVDAPIYDADAGAFVASSPVSGALRAVYTVPVTIFRIYYTPQLGNEQLAAWLDNKQPRFDPVRVIATCNGILRETSFTPELSPTVSGTYLAGLPPQPYTQDKGATQYGSPVTVHASDGSSTTMQVKYETSVPFINDRGQRITLKPSDQGAS
ncbi:MAG: hypothetical protein HQL66_03285 [Magnetococcales bacterium]|nr:hypothetical protein [Magnetococcales bacterium]